MNHSELSPAYGLSVLFTFRQPH